MPRTSRFIEVTRVALLGWVGAGLLVVAGCSPSEYGSVKVPRGAEPGGQAGVWPECEGGDEPARTGTVPGRAENQAGSSPQRIGPSSPQSSLSCSPRRDLASPRSKDYAQRSVQLTQGGTRACHQLARPGPSLPRIDAMAFRVLVSLSRASTCRSSRPASSTRVGGP